jgi:ribonuclease D
MRYYKTHELIRAQIEQLAETSLLWLDTEVADYQTQQPRLSLIQILADTDASDQSLEGLSDRAVILDVLDQPGLIAEFCDRIMHNPAITKVFHHANYDLRFLGKTRAKNVVCTLEMANRIPYYCLPIPNRQLKTLAKELCNIDLAKEQQGSDWGQRPLTSEQLEYAKFDPVVLARVHRCLTALHQQHNPDPLSEDVTDLALRYLEIQHQWKLLDTEVKHLQDRLKQAMQAQEQLETEHCTLSSMERSQAKVTFIELVQFLQDQAITLDFPITLTQDLKKKLGKAINQLPVQSQDTITWRLTFKQTNPDDLEQSNDGIDQDTWAEEGSVKIVT